MEQGTFFRGPVLLCCWPPFLWFVGFKRAWVLLLLCLYGDLRTYTWTYIGICIGIFYAEICGEALRPWPRGSWTRGSWTRGPDNEPLNLNQLFRVILHGVIVRFKESFKTIRTTPDFHSTIISISGNTSPHFTNRVIARRVGGPYE